MEKRDLGLKDELDNLIIKYIYDLYRMLGFRRIIFLLSISIYVRVNRFFKRFRKEFVVKMIVKGILIVVVSLKNSFGFY